MILILAVTVNEEVASCCAAVWVHQERLVDATANISGTLRHIGLAKLRLHGCYVQVRVF